MSSGGQVLGGVVGAVAGFFLGGGPTGAVYGAQIGMMAGGYLDPVATSIRPRGRPSMVLASTTCRCRPAPMVRSSRASTAQ